MRSITIGRAVCLLMFTLVLTPSLKAAPMLDIVVLMDSSGSLTDPDYLEQKAVVAHLFDSFTIGASDTQFSLIQFATLVQTEIGLSGSGTALNNALSNSFQLYGQTNHGGAFAAAAGELASNGRGGSVQEVVILMTDGQANEPTGGPGPINFAIAEALSLKSSGALLFSVGFGTSIDMSTLELYASNPTSDFTYLVDEFTDGIAVMDDIAAYLNGLPGPTATVYEPASVPMLLIGLLVLCSIQSRRQGNNAHLSFDGSAVVAA